MRCWRIVKARRADEALSGEGARIYGGRWNHAGLNIVYASTSLSLAALEVFVHLDRYDMGLHFTAIELDVPDTSTEVLDAGSLPAGWRTFPAPDICKEIGTRWVREQRSLVLLVPSIIVPQEHNVLISCDHPTFNSVRVASTHDFAFDARLWKQL